MVPGKHIVAGSSPVGEGESRPQDWTRGANRGVPWLLEMAMTLEDEVKIGSR